MYPIVFNAFKHHKRYITNVVNTSQDWEELLMHLDTIGESVTDLYIGTLEVESIFEETVQQLIAQDISEANQYNQYLKKVGGYRKISLSDNSDWVLLPGNDPEKFIHIHPARESPHCVRVKTSRLKTVIGLLFFKLNGKEINASMINEVRAKIGLSPINPHKSHEGIERLCQAFDI